MGNRSYLTTKDQLREYLAEHEWSEETRMATLKAMAAGGLSYSTTKAAIALIDFALSALKGK